MRDTSLGMCYPFSAVHECADVGPLRILHQNKFFENVIPVNFNTIATPHIGIPRFPSTFSAIVNYVGPRLLSRTGEQFFCVDKWSPRGRPILDVLADPG